MNARAKITDPILNSLLGIELYLCQLLQMISLHGSNPYLIPSPICFSSWEANIELQHRRTLSPALTRISRHSTHLPMNGAWWILLAIYPHQTESIPRWHYVKSLTFRVNVFQWLIWSLTFIIVPSTGRHVLLYGGEANDAGNFKAY